MDETTDLLGPGDGLTIAGFDNARKQPVNKSSYAQDMNRDMQRLEQQFFTPPKQTLSQRLHPDVSPGVQYYDPGQVDRYAAQENFNPFGFNPDDPYNNQRFAEQETFSTALSKGFDSFSTKFGNTFTDYWKSYGRMGDALLHMDWDLMKPDEATQIEQYYNDQLDADKNYVFQMPEDEDSIFSKRTMSEFIGNSGFALGTFAGMGIEIAADIAIEAASFGAATPAVAASVAGITAKLGQIAKGFQMGNRTVEEISAGAKIISKMDEAAKVANASSSAMRRGISETFNVFSGNLLNIGKSKNFAELSANMLKSTPLLGTGVRYGERVGAAIKAGASTPYLLGMGAQGVRRVAQELNMSATEASFEAVTSYGDTLNKMVEQYRADHDGESPDAIEFEKMRSLSMDASASNYTTNMAVLMATNQLQFGNLFNKFTPANKAMREIMEEAADDVLKVETQGLTKLYKKGFAGAYGVTGQIARDFGKKEAAYQFGKAFVKDAARFELSEGLQENLQETTAAGWRDYYAGKYNGTEYSMNQAFGKGFNEQFSKQGLKTFLMGALTGSVIRLPTAAAQRSFAMMSDKVVANQYKSNPEANPVERAKQQIQQDLDTMNTLFKQVSEGRFSQKVFNFNNQVSASQDMAEAAAKGLKYEFENASENALLSSVSAANRTNSIGALQQAIKNMGETMTPEDFEASFGVKLEDTKYATPKEFADNVAKDIKTYSDNIDGIRRKVGALADPYIYEQGSKSQFVASMLRNTQEDAIQLLALNSIKGSMAAERSKSIANDIMSIPGMSTSADYSLRALTTPMFLEGEKGNIVGELRVLSEQLELEGIDAESKAALKEEIKHKQEELALLNKWESYWAKGKDDNGNDIPGGLKDVFVGKTIAKKQTVTDENDEVIDEVEESFNPIDEEVVETFRQLMNIKNKQAGINTPISETAMREGFNKIHDYIRLNKDTRDYMRSVDVLTNPENYKHALTRMADGNFKMRLIVHVDGIGIMLANRTQEFADSLELDEAQTNDVYQTIATAVVTSESYNNLLMLVSNPEMGLQNSDYAISLLDKLNDVITSTLTELTIKYAPVDFTSDISDEEMKTAKETGELDVVRRNIIVNKLSNNEELGKNEQEAYTLFKEEIDSEVARLKEVLGENEEVPMDETTHPAETPKAPTEYEEEFQEGEVESDSQSTDPASVMLLFQDLQAGKPLESFTPVQQYILTSPDFAHYADLEVTPIEGEEEAAPEVEQPAPASDTTDVGDGSQDATAMLQQLMGITPTPVQEEPFAVVADGVTGFVVQDRDEIVVDKDAPSATEDEAQEKANGLNAARQNMDFAKAFIAARVAAADLDPQNVIIMHDRAMVSMKLFNVTHKTAYTTLEEYNKTADGARLLAAIRESVATGKPITYNKKQPIVISSAENQPVLFNTTTSNKGSAINLDSLTQLDARIQKIKREALQDKDKNVNFVDESNLIGEVTELSIIEQLQKISSCF